MPTRGWFNMACWNGLSHEQQRRLIEHGNLPIDYRPEGECQNPASVCIETQDDEAEGPRFYCVECAIRFLQKRCPGCDTLLDRGECTNPHCRFWRFGREFDRVTS